MVELYKEVIAEADFLGKNNVTESQPLSGERKDGQNQQEKLQNVTSEDRVPSGITSEKLQPEVGEIKGTYVVGGSAFGWNFITFSGKEPVYYGVTKESFRAAKVTPR